MINESDSAGREAPTDPLWDELRRAESVADAGDSTFHAVNAKYLSRLEASGRPAAAASRRSRWTALGAIAATAATVAGLSTLSLGRGEEEPVAGSVNPDTTASSILPEPTPDLVGTEPSKPAAVTTFATGDGATSLVGYFGAPTFVDFTNTAYVSDVIEGVIESATSRFVKSADDGSIVTEITVRVTRSRQVGPGETVTVIEPGGIVPRRLYEGELSKKYPGLDPKQLDGYVEERYNGRAPDQVGDHVLLAVTRTDEAKPPTVTTSLLAATGGDYTWVGSPPNPEWSTQVEAAEVERLFQRGAGGE